MNNSLSHNDRFENRKGLRNISIKDSLFNAVIKHRNSMTELRCIVEHAGIQRIHIGGQPKGKRFECIKFKVGDVLKRRNIIMTNPDNWVLAKETAKA